MSSCWHTCVVGVELWALLSSAFPLLFLERLPLAVVGIVAWKILDHAVAFKHKQMVDGAVEEKRSWLTIITQPRNFVM